MAQLQKDEDYNIPPGITLRPTLQRADLKEEELAQLQALLQINELAKTANHPVETFLSMVREHMGVRLDALEA